MRLRCWLLGALLLGAGCGTATLPEDLEARVQAAEPRWENYDEDLKGMIGAAAVALWAGEVRSAVHAGAVVEVELDVAPPWTEQAASIPLLLRTPSGDVVRAVAERSTGPHRTYRFPLEDAAAPGQLSWVQVRLPGAERRLPLDSAGTWRPRP